MLKPVPDDDLLGGKYGDIGSLVMIKRDMARARISQRQSGARMRSKTPFSASRMCFTPTL